MALGKTLSELEGMSQEEITGWMAFHQLEPFGSAVEDGRFALLADLTWAVNSSSKKDPPIWFERDGSARIKPDPTPEQLDENIRDFFMGKTIKVDAKGKKIRKPRRRKAPTAG